MTTRSLVFRLAALALVYAHGGFQLELDAEEYEKNHPSPSSLPTFVLGGENWETFDRTDAPPAFVVRVDRDIILYCYLPKHPHRVLRAFHPPRLVRDKSPPLDILQF
jgi:hypothetical protein